MAKRFEIISMGNIRSFRNDNSILPQTKTPLLRFNFSIFHCAVRIKFTFEYFLQCYRFHKRWICLASSEMSFFVCLFIRLSSMTRREGFYEHNLFFSITHHRCIISHHKINISSSTYRFCFTNIKHAFYMTQDARSNSKGFLCLH